MQGMDDRAVEFVGAVWGDFEAGVTQVPILLLILLSLDKEAI